MKTLLQRKEGAVMIEFIIVVLPFLIFLLCLIQLGFMLIAQLAVEQSAGAAARAAVVVLDDDPDEYGGATQNSLRGGGSATNPDPVFAYLAWLSANDPSIPPPSGAISSQSDNPRLRDIRAAATIPLLAVPAPVHLDVGAYSLRSALAPNQTTASAGITRASLAVTFPSAPGAADSTSDFELDEVVDVRVGFAFHCGVPLARQILCRDLATEPQLAFTADGSAESNASTIAALFSSARFRVLSARAALPNQGANYDK